MRPVTTTVGPLATASATNIRTASAVGAAGAMTLNGTLVSAGSSVANGSIVPAGTAVLDMPRRVIFTSSGNDTGITFTVTGTDNAGNAQTEVVTGSNASTASTVLSYKTFAPPVASGAAAGTVSIGTNGVAASPWVRLDNWAPGGVAIQATVTGTVNYTIQQTMDDPNSATNPVAPASVTWVDSADIAVVGATATKQSNYAFAPTFARVLLNSGTGSVSTTFTQLGTPAR
jgi:hypothetical protein